MKFKVGDKVSFLNEKRNGVITKVLGNKMVVVAIEEGFEIPVIETDLVNMDYFVPAESVEMPTDEETEDFPERFDLMKPKHSHLKQGFYLSFLPDDAQSKGGGKTHVYLTNHTIFDALFSYSLLINNEFVCCDFDRIDSETAIKLSTIGSSEFDAWKTFAIQAIHFIKDSTQQLAPLVAEMKFNPVKFYKEDSYPHTDIFDYPAMCILLKNDKNPDPVVWEDKEWKNIKTENKPGLKIVGHINQLNKPVAFPDKYMVGKDSAEIDLHIEELVDDYAGKSNHELLTIQTDFFIKMLEEAIQAKLKQIVFIHGVGNGSLKKALHEKLKNEYSFLRFQDAPMAKYGTGATVVILS